MNSPDDSTLLATEPGCLSLLFQTGEWYGQPRFAYGGREAGTLWYGIKTGRLGGGLRAVVLDCPAVRPPPAQSVRSTAPKRFSSSLRETVDGPEANPGDLVIIPVFKPATAGGIWAVVLAWVQARGRVALERENRLTVESVMRDMSPGDIWLDCDGDRTRLIARPPIGGVSMSPQLAQVGVLLRLGRLSPQLREEAGDSSSG